MSTLKTRTFELVSTVTFHAISVKELEPFARKLASAVGGVLGDYPAVEAFFVEPDMVSGDVNFGLRFKAVDPDFAEDMADEILENAVELVAQREDAKPVEAEREESVLILTQ